jgi:hypothetical protein
LQDGTITNQIWKQTHWLKGTDLGANLSRFKRNTSPVMQQYEVLNHLQVFSGHAGTTDLLRHQRL